MADEKKIEHRGEKRPYIGSAEDYFFDMMRNMSDNIKEQGNKMTEHILGEQEMHRKLEERIFGELRLITERLSKIEKSFEQLSVLKWLSLAIMTPFFAAGGVHLYKVLAHFLSRVGP